jgi:hypothetical protein
MVIFIVIFTVCQFMPREAIWSMVLLCWDVDELEVKK